MEERSLLKEYDVCGIALSIFRKDLTVNLVTALIVKLKDVRIVAKEKKIVSVSGIYLGQKKIYKEQQ